MHVLHNRRSKKMSPVFGQAAMPQFLQAAFSEWWVSTIARRQPSGPAELDHAVGALWVDENGCASRSVCTEPVPRQFAADPVSVGLEIQTPNDVKKTPASVALPRKVPSNQLSENRKVTIERRTTSRVPIGLKKRPVETSRSLGESPVTGRMTPADRPRSRSPIPRQSQSQIPTASHNLDQVLSFRVMR